MFTYHQFENLPMPLWRILFWVAKRTKGTRFGDSLWRAL